MQKELNFEYNELITPFEWSYSPFTKMWYEDEKDKFPEIPLIPKSIYKDAYLYFGIEILDEYKNDLAAVTKAAEAEDEDEKKEFLEYINYLFGKTEKGNDCFGLNLLLFFSNSETNIESYEQICLCHDNLPFIEQLIKDVNQYGYSSFYIEAFSGVKFFAWSHDDKIHLVLQDYKYAKFTETNTPIFRILCNFQADKEEFCNRILELVNLYKTICKNAVLNYLKNNPTAKLSGYDTDFVKWFLGKEQTNV